MSPWPNYLGSNTHSAADVNVKRILVAASFFAYRYYRYIPGHQPHVTGQATGKKLHIPESQKPSSAIVQLTGNPRIIF